MTGYGTGGTFSGAGKVIKAARPETQIILAEPDAAGLIASGIPQERAENGVTHAKSHPAFTPHPIQGWTPDFIPHVLQGGLDSELYDEVRR